MARVVVIGGGMVGLATGMMLARDGHDVTVVERDAGGPPPDADQSWRSWERRGVNQFRQLHFLQPGSYQVLATELPEVVAELDADGAIRYNAVAGAPEPLRGGERPGDDRFTLLTGRRPMMEAALARVAERTTGLSVRRGVAVTALMTDGDRAVPDVVGVRLDDATDVSADVVVDASGRRSALPSLLMGAGARAPFEEKDDCGFMYYGRHFRSADGTVPPAIGPLLQDGETVSVLTLPGDNGTWGIGLITSSRDTEARALRDVDRWTELVRTFPLAAHWLDGEALDESVLVMAKLEDRYRRFVVDGSPVAGGILAVGDAWACTNPSLGRGISMGLLHARALRDLLRTGPLEDPHGLATAWDEVTERTLAPWYRATLDYDRHRIAGIDAALAGRPYETDDPGWEITKAMGSAAGKDPEALRALLRIFSVLDLPDEVLAEPGLLDTVMAAGGDWRNDPPIGPSAAEARATLARPGPTSA